MEQTYFGMRLANLESNTQSLLVGEKSESDLGDLVIPLMLKSRMVRYSGRH